MIVTSVARYVFVEGHAVAHLAGIMLAKALDDVDIDIAKRRSDDLGSFSSPRELTAHEHIGRNLCGGGESVA